MVTHIEDLFESVRGLIITQYALFDGQGAPASNLMRMLAAIVRSLQTLEDSIAVVAGGLDIGSATGAWLDFIGGILGAERRTGESDDEYRARLNVLAKNDSAGTADNLIENAKDISGDDSPQFLDEAPATFFVYTPDGRQLTRSQVQKMAPAGVLGLPGAAIKTADGKFLCDAQGRRILAVAQDFVDDPENAIATERGVNITTEKERIIVTEDS